ncbi:FadR/GntR family transcriptional regulator [Bacillus sp. FSL H8-0547]
MKAFIKKQLVHELVADEIKQYIRTHSIQKGDKLPSMGELAEMFRVSRTSIREALRQLEAVHFVEIINGKGILVKDADFHHLQTRIKIECDLEYLLNLCDVRRGLEGRAIELAVKKITEEQLEKMEHNLMIFKKVKILTAESVQADYLFHQTLYEASHNPVLTKMIITVYNDFYEFWEKHADLSSFFEDTYQFHEDLFHWIREKDGYRAKEAFQLMVDVLEAKIRELL